MTRYTLHVPETFNDGAPVGQEAFEEIESRVLTIAGGFTLSHGIGAWRGDDGRTYREPVRLYIVDADDNAERALRDLAERVAVALQQEAVYLTRAEIVPDLVYPNVPATV